MKYTSQSQPNETPIDAKLYDKTARDSQHLT